MENQHLKPFKIKILEDDINDLKKRLENIRFPDEEINKLNEDDITLEKMKKWINYWKTDYDFLNLEKKLNQFSQYKIKIDDHSIHFVHIPSSKENAVPLLMIHGWPSSPLEFLEISKLLTNDFELIIPTIPGFGISGQTIDWNTDQVAVAFLKLMDSLEKPKYMIHGGDYGATIARKMAVAKPDRILGIHLTMLSHASATEEDINREKSEEVESLEKVYKYQYESMGYATIQSLKPQDISYAMSDSPSGLLAWIGSAFISWRDHEIELDIELLIDTAMIYWLYNTLSSSARYYKNETDAWAGSPKVNTVSTAVSIMPNDIALPIKRIAEKTDNIIQWNKSEYGGHFSTIEVPKIIAKNLISFKNILED